MATKETKRKGFNFLRSYFDVFNELTNDKDRLSFLTSIINKQFLDENPKGLNFIVNLCYESQRHQIETSVKGWKRATNDTLGATPPTTPPTTPKEVEEEEKEEEKEELLVRAFETEEQFINGFNLAKGIATGTKGKSRIMSATDKNNFKRLNEAYTKADFNHAIKMMSKDEWVKTKKMFNISHFLRNDNFNKFINQTDTLPMAQGLREGN